MFAECLICSEQNHEAEHRGKRKGNGTSPSCFSCFFVDPLNTSSLSPGTKFVPNKSSERFVGSTSGGMSEWDVDRVWSKCVR